MPGLMVDRRHCDLSPRCERDDRMTIDQVRHVPLRAASWNAGEVTAAIEEIAADALAHFDAARFWPVHPLDDGVADGNASFYIGATGMIWALDYLGRVGATEPHFDFRPVLPRLIEVNKAQFAAMDYSAHGSLLFGDLGTALLAMRLDPSPATADVIEARAAANTALPVRELMWGLPGSMLACVHMGEMTGEPRWPALFATQAARLLDDLEDTAHGPLWMQDLYGSRLRFLGAVHGYAGNMIPLIRGWDWLTEEQRARVAAAVPRTLIANAERSD